jgi:hypothetical protein
LIFKAILALQVRAPRAEMPVKKHKKAKNQLLEGLEVFYFNNYVKNVFHNVITVADMWKFQHLSMLTLF